MINSVFHNHSIAYSRPAPSIAPAAPTTGTNGEPSEDHSATGAAAPADAEPGNAGATGAQTTPESKDTDEQGLTDQEQRDVQELRDRDREVRAHEQAHLAAAGQYARGGIQYTFERGPDNRQYAVGGQVSVDTSKVPGDPEATLRKAETLRRAALAPANPSSQDRSVAAQMTRMAAQARQDIATETREDTQTAVSDATQSESTDNNDAQADALAAPAASEALSCPACGGRHSADAHDGMMAYAGPAASQASTFAAV